MHIESAALTLCCIDCEPCKECKVFRTHDGDGKTASNLRIQCAVRLPLAIQKGKVLRLPGEGTMTKWIGLVVGIFLVMASGCIVHPSQGAGGGGTATAGGATAGGATANGNSVIRVQNNSSTTICYVRFSPASAPTWAGATDALGSSTIGGGQYYDFAIGSGQWDIMLEACGSGNSPFGHPKLHESRQNIAPGQSYVLSFP